MKTTILLILGFFTSMVFADVLVLRNGKTMVFEGTYEVKGSYVVFKDDQGQLVQLPIKLVDLEKSQVATVEFKKELERQAAAQAAKPPEEKESMSMSEIAEMVEAKRPKDQPPPRVVLGNDKLDAYSSANPAPKNNAMEVASFEPLTTPEKMEEARKELIEAHAKLQGELDQLDAAVDSAVQYADSLAQESAFGDDPTGSMFEAMEKADKAVEDLRKKREEKANELKSLENAARQAGLRNYKSNQARPQQTQQDDDQDQENQRN